MNPWSRLLVACSLLAFARPAAAAIQILVDQPEDNRFPIAIANIVAGEGFSGDTALLKKIPEIIRNDLNFSGYFFVIHPKIHQDKTVTVGSGDIPFEKWSAIGARGLVKGFATGVGDRITVQLRLFDVASREMQMGKEYTFSGADLRTIAHRFSDEIMKSATGTRGPFSTKIAYTLTTGSGKKSAWKQIYVMDIDGANGWRATKDRSYNLAPNWSPDGKNLVFTSYVDGFPDIYTIDVGSGKRTRITSNESTNITPTFSRDGSWIAFSSGMAKDMEIYLVPSFGGEPRVFAPSFGADLSPRFSPDGNEVVFASERGGKLNLYKKAMGDGGTPTRITFHGGLSDSPDWSPDGTKIAFANFAGNVYQIYTISPDGSGLKRLTYEGSNEHPRWSPDSRYITYHNTMGRKSRVYVMRFDGINKTPITKGHDATLPDWGPWPMAYYEDME